MNTATFTQLEKAVLRELFKSSDANGHDFGILEDLHGVKIPGLRNRQQLGGLITSLQAKGVIEVAPPHRVNHEYVVTQFTFTAAGLEAAREKPATHVGNPSSSITVTINADEFHGSLSGEYVFHGDSIGDCVQAFNDWQEVEESRGHLEDIANPLRARWPVHENGRLIGHIDGGGSFLAGKS